MRFEGFGCEDFTLARDLQDEEDFRFRFSNPETGFRSSGFALAVDIEEGEVRGAQAGRQYRRDMRWSFVYPTGAPHS